jgi:3-phenylpropionate/cinnamic acid dioxygenase small subunit
LRLHARPRPYDPGERSGRKARLERLILRIFDDGTPRTRHVTSNIIIEVDEDAGTARSRAYYTVFQAALDFALQPIACGRYRDRFERVDGKWYFAERSVQMGPGW